MTIETIYTAAHKPRYFIKSADGAHIAQFDSLETAGLVLRYLKGAPMTKGDCVRAVEEMQAYDRRKQGQHEH